MSWIKKLTDVPRICFGMYENSDDDSYSEEDFYSCNKKRDIESHKQRIIQRTSNRNIDLQFRHGYKDTCSNSDKKYLEAVEQQSTEINELETPEKNISSDKEAYKKNVCKCN